MIGDNIAEIILRRGKDGIKENIMNGFTDLADLIASDMYAATEELLSLRKENAILRKRLENAIKIPFVVLDKQTGKEADMGKITKEDWASNLMRHDIESFAVMENGNLALLDECGNWAYCPSDRFEIIFGKGVSNIYNYLDEEENNNADK